MLFKESFAWQKYIPRKSQKQPIMLESNIQKYLNFEYWRSSKQKL